MAVRRRARHWRVFRYQRCAPCWRGATALLIGLVAGPRDPPPDRNEDRPGSVRAYGPESHLVKTGTPTMARAHPIAIAISTLLWADWTNASSGWCCW